MALFNFSDIDVAMGSVRGMPSLEAIPLEYTEFEHPMAAFAEEAYRDEVETWKLRNKRPNTDRRAVIRQFTAWVRSFDAEYERKIAACAWLLDVHFNLEEDNED